MTIIITSCPGLRKFGLRSSPLYLSLVIFVIYVIIMSDTVINLPETVHLRGEWMKYSIKKTWRIR